MASLAIPNLALEQGLLVFPVGRRSKVPIITAYPERATNDRRLVEHWAEVFHGCNWAALTGKLADDVSIDIDGDAGRASLAKLPPLPPTLTVRTGRMDGGQQYHYRYPAGRVLHNSTGRIGPGIDIKANNNPAIIPDSIHPKTGILYSWENPRDRAMLPDSWADLMDQDWESRHAPPCNVIERDNDADVLAADVQLDHQPRHYGFRALLPKHRTNGLLHVAGKLRRKGASLDQITSVLLAQNLQRCHPPLPTRKVIAMAQDIVSRYSPLDGPDTLEQAWSQLSFCHAATTRFKLRSLALELQRSRPNQTIVLPQERIAALLGVDQNVVSRMCRNMVATGFLQPAGDYIPHVRAQAYRVLIDL